MILCKIILKLSENTMKDQYNNLERFIFLCIKRDLSLYAPLNSLTNSNVFRFLIFRKLHKDIRAKSKMKVFSIVSESFLFTKKKSVFLSQLQIDVLLIINCLLLRTTKKSLNKIKAIVKYTNIYGITWMAKKETLNLSLTQMHFFLLFDQLKNFTKNKNLLNILFRIYKANLYDTQSQTIFYKLFLFFVNFLLTTLFDGPLNVFLFKIIRIKTYKDIMKKTFLNFFKKTICFSLRSADALLIGLQGKKIYVDQSLRDVIDILNQKTKIKVKKDNFSIIKPNRQKVPFLGFYFLSSKETNSYHVLEINLIKLLIRLCCLGYCVTGSLSYTKHKINAHRKELSRQTVARLMFQSISNYFKVANDCKSMVNRFAQLIKVYISKTSVKKFKSNPNIKQQIMF